MSPRSNDSVTFPRFVTASSRKRPRLALVARMPPSTSRRTIRPRSTDDDHDAHAHTDGEAVPDPPTRREENERVVISRLRARRNPRGDRHGPRRARADRERSRTEREPGGGRAASGVLPDDSRATAQIEREPGPTDVEDHATRSRVRHPDRGPPRSREFDVRRGGGERHRRPCSARAGRCGREQKQGSETGAAQGGSDHRPTTV